MNTIEALGIVPVFRKALEEASVPTQPRDFPRDLHVQVTESTLIDFHTSQTYVSLYDSLSDEFVTDDIQLDEAGCCVLQGFDSSSWEDLYIISRVYQSSSFSPKRRPSVFSSRSSGAGCVVQQSRGFTRIPLHSITNCHHVEKAQLLSGRVGEDGRPIEGVTLTFDITVTKRTPVEKEGLIYVEIRDGAFAKPKWYKKGEMNVQVRVALCGLNGELVDYSVRRGGPNNGYSDSYDSSVTFHMNTPSFRELVVVKLPSTDTLHRFHLLFEMRHCSTQESKPRPFSFAFLDLFNARSGQLIVDRTHSIPCYMHQFKLEPPSQAALRKLNAVGSGRGFVLADSLFGRKSSNAVAGSQSTKTTPNSVDLEHPFESRSGKGSGKSGKFTSLLSRSTSMVLRSRASSAPANPDTDPLNISFNSEMGSTLEIEDALATWGPYHLFETGGRLSVSTKVVSGNLSNFEIVNKLLLWQMLRTSEVENVVKLIRKVFTNPKHVAGCFKAIFTALLDLFVDYTIPEQVTIECFKTLTALCYEFRSSEYQEEFVKCTKTHNVHRVHGELLQLATHMLKNNKQGSRYVRMSVLGGIRSIVNIALRSYRISNLQDHDFGAEKEEYDFKAGAEGLFDILALVLDEEVTLFKSSTPSRSSNLHDGLLEDCLLMFHELSDLFNEEELASMYEDIFLGNMISEPILILGNLLSLHSLFSHVLSKNTRFMNIILPHLVYTLEHFLAGPIKEERILAGLVVYDVLEYLSRVPNEEVLNSLKPLLFLYSNIASTVLDKGRSLSRTNTPQSGSSGLLKFARKSSIAAVFTPKGQPDHEMVFGRSPSHRDVPVFKPKPSLSIAEGSPLHVLLKSTELVQKIAVGFLELIHINTPDDISRAMGPTICASVSAPTLDSPDMSFSLEMPAIAKKMQVDPLVIPPITPTSSRRTSRIVSSPLSSRHPSRPELTGSYQRGMFSSISVDPVLSILRSLSGIIAVSSLGRFPNLRYLELHEIYHFLSLVLEHENFTVLLHYKAPAVVLNTVLRLILDLLLTPSASKDEHLSKRRLHLCTRASKLFIENYQAHHRSMLEIFVRESLFVSLFQLYGESFYEDVERFVLMAFFRFCEHEILETGQCLGMEGKTIDIITRFRFETKDRKGSEAFLKQIFSTVKRIGREHIRLEKNKTKDLEAKFIALVVDAENHSKTLVHPSDESIHEDVVVEATILLMESFKAQGRQDLYVRHLLRLIEFHRNKSNSIETAKTYLRYAEDLNWDFNTILPGAGILPEESCYARKVRVMEEALTILELNGSWELYADICRRLAHAEESIHGDYTRACEYLMMQVEALGNSQEKLPLYPKYFFVRFHGTGFDKLNGRKFIYKSGNGRNMENAQEFRQRIKEMYTHPEKEETLVEITKGELVGDPDYDGRFIEIYGVKPSTSKALLGGENEIWVSSLPMHVKEFKMQNNVDVFEYSRVIKAPPAEKHKQLTQKNEFNCLWVKKSYFRTAEKLPTISRRVEVIKTVEKIVTPMRTAIDHMNYKTIEVWNCIGKVGSNPDRYIGELSMLLNGVIDAAVNGGVAKYEDAFITSNYLDIYPEEQEAIEDFSQAFTEQVHVLGVGLDLFRSHADAELSPLCDHLFKMFETMRTPKVSEHSNRSIS